MIEITFSFKLAFQGALEQSEVLHAPLSGLLTAEAMKSCPRCLEEFQMVRTAAITFFLVS